jgi:RNA-directed DNA polymerase
MIKASIGLQDLRRKIYRKAKSDKTWRFWGLYVHVCKMETLHWAYLDAKENNGAPGVDGVTFDDIEKAGVEAFLERIQNELVSGTYRPMRNRIKEIPKDDDKVMRLLKLILKAGGKRGVPQGSVISPLLSNIYLNEVDKMLERAKKVTRYSRFTYIEYARFADDLVVLVDGFWKWEWLLKAAYKRLVEEFKKLDVQMNQDKTRIVDLTRDETFSFLGFDYRRVRTRRGVWGVRVTPKTEKRTALLRKLKEVFRRHQSQPEDRIIYLINPILRGWVNYFRVGNSSKCFGYIKDWVEKKIRRNLMGARKRRGFGWDRWSRVWLYETLGLFNDYGVRHYKA